MSLPANASTEGYAADPPTVLQIAKPRGLLVQGGAIARSVTVSRVSIVPPVDALLSEPGIGIEVAQSASPTIELVQNHRRAAQVRSIIERQQQLAW